MGMTIDVQDPKAFAEWCKFIGTIPKADYENRLKADMVSMLTEIQLEIEEIDSRPGYDGNGMPTFSNDYVRIMKVNEIIQQKIDALK